MTRARGINVFPMPENVCGPLDSYALLIRSDGQMRMVHTEGVAYEVSNEKPWQWDDYSEDAEKFSPNTLEIFARNSEPVDLADWVRSFGMRLDHNFSLIHHWAREYDNWVYSVTQGF